jgi:hypothetical protein
MLEILEEPIYLVRDGGDRYSYHTSKLRDGKKKPKMAAFDAVTFLTNYRGELSYAERSTVRFLTKKRDLPFLCIYRNRNPILLVRL